MSEPTDQIAAEAAKKIQRKHPFLTRFEIDNSVYPIIQAAIEKATKPYRDTEDKICELIEETKITEPEGSPVSRVASLCSWVKPRAAQATSVEQVRAIRDEWDKRDHRAAQEGDVEIYYNYREGGEKDAESERAQKESTSQSQDATG